MYSTLSKLFLPNLFLKAQILFLLKVVKRQKSNKLTFTFKDLVAGGEAGWQVLVFREAQGRLSVSR